MLEAENIAFTYPGAKDRLFSGVSLCVQPGQRMALSAPSGAGKTTLCRVLAGYLLPSAGTVTVDGSPLPKRGLSPVQMVGQHPELAVDPRLRLGKTLAEAGDVDSGLMDALGIRPEWLSRFPHELSGGELQRFCIARAVTASPRYLIADEVSTMLDAYTQACIWSFLLEWQEREHVGMVVVTHSPSLQARLATDVVELSDLISLD